MEVDCVFVFFHLFSFLVEARSTHHSAQTRFSTSRLQSVIPGNAISLRTCLILILNILGQRSDVESRKVSRYALNVLNALNALVVFVIKQLRNKVSQQNNYALIIMFHYVSLHNFWMPKIITYTNFNSLAKSLEIYSGEINSFVSFIMRWSLNYFTTVGARLIFIAQLKLLISTPLVLFVVDDVLCCSKFVDQLSQLRWPESKHPQSHRTVMNEKWNHRNFNQSFPQGLKSLTWKHFKHHVKLLRERSFDMMQHLWQF